MSTTKRMVAGFLFSHDLSLVALVRKNRPDWMAGKLNAIGGHIEESDASPKAAQIREFKEEAGVQIDHWTEVCSLAGIGWEVTFFAARSSLLRNIESNTDETVLIYPVVDLTRLGERAVNDVMPNLAWLIPMAACALDNPEQGRYLISSEPAR